MAAGLRLAALAGFAVLMTAAAVNDFRRLVIPNALVVALCALWPLHFCVVGGAALGSALESIAGAAIVLVAGAFLFARGVVGGGDVKLLAAASLWAGAGAVPALLLWTALIGGLLALAFLTPFARLSGAGRRASVMPQPALPVAGRNTPLPYGVAIAVAALIVTLPPYLS
jgi:prepilin peptidase CpaA